MFIFYSLTSFLFKLHGAAYGKGIYLSPSSSISFGYSGMNAQCNLISILLCIENDPFIQRLPLLKDASIFFETFPLCSEMGKGRHQIPTKEELIKKYNHINKIKQVDHHSRLSRICRDALLFSVSYPVFSSSLRNSRGKPGFCKTGT